MNPTIGMLTGDCPNNSGTSSTYDQSRRWSGVQLGSKLMQAFDRLNLYDDSEDYTDSLENEHKRSSEKSHTEFLHDEVNN